MTLAIEAVAPAFDEPGLTPAGLRILDAASDLFYARGIRAVGVDLIALEAGTTKKTLYDRFGSKDGLVARYLARRAARWQRLVLEHVTGEPDPRARVSAVFDALERWHAGQTRGCAFVNAYAEVGATDEKTLEVVRAEKRWMRHLFVALAADAGAPEPDATGATLHLLYEGALVLATAGGIPTAVADARTAAQDLLEAQPTARGV
jgi:AcrR family transcriptional regulator